MKLDLNTSNLDWSKATVRDYRYIHHLMLMINERWLQLGIAPSGLPSSSSSDRLPSEKPTSKSVSAAGTNIFRMNRYSPGGLLTWDQLSSIYHAMTYLGLYVYFNPDNFKEENYVKGDLRKLPVFDLKDMCRIAEFDFFAHPFIPGQPIDYYSQFLWPIKKVLSAYKFISSNSYIIKQPTNESTPTPATGIAGSTYYIFPKQTVKVDGVEYGLLGNDKINYLANGQNHLSALREYYECYKNGINFTEKYKDRYVGYGNSGNTACLGYDYSVQSLYFASNDYNQSEEYHIDSGLAITAYTVTFGNLFKLTSAYPAGLPYTIYLYHTTYSKRAATWYSEFYNYAPVPKYFNSPWDMIIKVRDGVVPDNCEVIEWIELPSWNDLPTSHPHSSFGQKYEGKDVIEDDRLDFVENPAKNTLAEADHYGAEYIPLFVFDFSSKFKYI